MAARSSSPCRRRRRLHGGDGAAGLPGDVGQACPFPETTGQDLGSEQLLVEEIVDARLVPAAGDVVRRQPPRHRADGGADLSSDRLDRHGVLHVGRLEVLGGQDGAPALFALLGRPRGQLEPANVPADRGRRAPGFLGDLAERDLPAPPGLEPLPGEDLAELVAADVLELTDWVPRVLAWGRHVLLDYRPATADAVTGLWKDPCEDP